MKVRLLVTVIVLAILVWFGHLGEGGGDLQIHDALADQPGIAVLPMTRGSARWGLPRHRRRRNPAPLSRHSCVEPAAGGVEETLAALPVEPE